MMNFNKNKNILFIVAMMVLSATNNIDVVEGRIKQVNEAYNRNNSKNNGQQQQAQRDLWIHWYETRSVDEDSSMSKLSSLDFYQPDGDIIVLPNVEDATLDSPGTMAILDKYIYDPADKTTPVGLVTGSCTRICSERWHCEGTYEFLPEELIGKDNVDFASTYPTGDSITVAGPFYPGRPVWNAIVGGTGKYASVKGQGYYVSEPKDWNHVTIYLDENEEQGQEVWDKDVDTTPNDEKKEEIETPLSNSASNAAFDKGEDDENKGITNGYGIAGIVVASCLVLAFVVYFLTQSCTNKKGSDEDNTHSKVKAQAEGAETSCEVESEGDVVDIESGASSGINNEELP